MIDEVDRRLIQLEMEKLSLRKETRADALKRVEQIDDEMMELQEKQVKHLFSNQLFATRKLCWRRSPTSAGVPYKRIYTCVTGGRYMSYNVSSHVERTCRKLSRTLGTSSEAV